MLCLCVPLVSTYTGCTPLLSIQQINEEIYPNDFDLTLARDKGIGSKRAYQKVYDNYSRLLSAYLNSLYSFSSLDEGLENKGLVPEDDLGYYLDSSQLGSKFLYLRNNIHVERLSEEDINYLKQDNIGTNDEEGLRIVKETCEEVLAVRLRSAGDTKEYKTSYHDSCRGDKFVPNTALVFFVEYVDMHTGDLSTEEYMRLRSADKKAVDDVSEEIIDALQPSFDVEVIIQNQQW